MLTHVETSKAHPESAIDLHRRIVDPSRIASVTVDVAKGAYDVLGGGSYGPKDVFRSKEQADHSLPYLLAAALLDGEMTPRQFEPGRILRSDVQICCTRSRCGPARPTRGASRTKCLAGSRP